jgi:Zn-dependent M28 family amino/carboxypeptidase
VVAGHIDSVREFQWWYHLKNFGGLLTIVAGALYILQGVFFLAIWLTDIAWGDIVWIVLAVLSPATFSMYAMHGKNVVDGAMDNLTGVAMAVEMVKVFGTGNGNSRLQNTRLRLVSFGSEECGLRGSTAYAKHNRAQLLKENALLVNIDTIKDKEQLSIITSEINTNVRYGKTIIAALNQAFVDSNVPVKHVKLSVGATDGSSFGMQKLPAISIIGLDSSQFDPCYHTRLDKLENLNPEAMDILKTVLVNFIEGFDSGKYKP